jgi:LacI family transcriptional regulator
MEVIRVELVGTRRRGRVSAADVARAAGVSAAAVSYVMNGRPGVSADTRTRVLEVAERLGHVPTERIAGLRQQRTRVIGLVLTDIANPFYTEIGAGVIDAARARGYEVFLAHTQEDRDTLQAVVDAMVARQVDGIVLTVLHPEDGEVVRSLRSAYVPFVQLSRRIERIGADFVGIDDSAAAAEVMEHVLGHGYQDVATISGPRNSSASAAREEAFVRTAAAYGVQATGVRRISTYLSEAGGQRAVQMMLSRDVLPRALVCGSDVIALGAMAALRAHGLRVPEDVAVTGFDGLFPAVSPLVGLTTVWQPRREMAEHALELLLRRVDGTGGSPQAVLQGHELRIGTSCGCPGTEVCNP